MDIEPIIRGFEGRIATTEQSLKSVHKRIDSIEKLTQSVHEIAIELKAQRGELQGIIQNVCDVKTRIDVIEDRPIKQLDLIIATIITAIVSGIMGMFLTKLIGG